MLSSREFPLPRDQTQVSCVVGRYFTIWAKGEALCKEGNLQIIQKDFHSYGLRVAEAFRFFP